MPNFKKDEQIVGQIVELIEKKNTQGIKEILHNLHPADVAQVITELPFTDARYVIKLLDKEKSSETLTELDDDLREYFLNHASSKEIADELLQLDTDDAADLIADLPEERQSEIISNIQDIEHARDIVDLLRYEENTAGRYMAKELIKVSNNLTVKQCLEEIRKQAQFVNRVHSIYVVDGNDTLIGRLSLKDLVTASEESFIKDLYLKKVDYVTDDENITEVARIMSKYDLESIPVVDVTKRLMGRITIDDIVDVIKEEADKDYQMANGISQDVEADDSIFKLTRARLPWLLIGMFGGLGAASIINGFQAVMSSFPIMLIFIPLIQATAGNVGVQSSAIVVQGLANDSIDGQVISRLAKEALLGFINGMAIASIALLISHFLFKSQWEISMTVAIALIAVIINAAVIGTFVPILLHKRGIDPAVATGPFITTSNDVLGILIYFLIGKIILGF